MDSLSRLIVAALRLLGLWCLFGIVTLAVGSSAFAFGTVAMSGGGGSGTGYYVGGQSCSVMGGWTGSTPTPTCTLATPSGIRYMTDTAACAAAVLTWSNGGTSTLSGPTYQSGVCYGRAKSPSDPTCSSGCVGVNGAISTGAGTLAGSCPANSSGTSTCSCNSGFKPDGTSTSCVAYTCTATTAGPDVQYSATSSSLAVRYFCESASGSLQGCELKFMPYFAAQGYAAGSWFATGPEIVTGTACDPAASGAGTAPGAPAVEPTEDTAPCPTGQVKVTVGGLTTCKQAAGATTSTGTTTKNGSGTVTGTTSSDTTCIGGACTTVTTSKDGAGATTGSVTTTSTLNGFCQQNPSSGMCGAGSGDGGSDSSFTSSCSAGAATIACDGDAVQCAIAREQHKRNCEFFDATTATKTKGEEAIARGDTKADDHPGHDDNVTTTAIGSAMDTTDIVGGSCPADQVVTITAGRTVVMPWSQVCTPAGWLGNLLVGLTSLAWVFIAFKRD